MHTPSPYSTIGPFFPFEFVDDCNDLTQFDGRKARGQHILLTGRVVEEGNIPTGNTILEIWQPDANGVFRVRNGRRRRSEPSWVIPRSK